MFKAGKLYRHRNCLDIDFEVRKVLGEDEMNISLIVDYWNRRGFWQARSQVVSVQKKDLENWREQDIYFVGEIYGTASKSDPAFKACQGSDQSAW